MYRVGLADICLLGSVTELRLIYIWAITAPGMPSPGPALAESVDDAFNLACTDTTEGLLQVSVGGDDQGYPLIEAGTSKLESSRLRPHVC